MKLAFIPEISCGAELSKDRVYRYTLWRVWDMEKLVLAFIGLNPSTANETEDDPTITRCVNYAKAWGYGGLFMLNIFAFRATDPQAMKAASDPVGQDNDRWIIRVADKVKIVVAAWGNHGEFMDRGKAVIELLHEFDLYYLGKLTKGGHPGHPLYLKADLTPELFRRGISRNKGGN